MVLVGGCLVAERGLNVMVPHQLGVVTNSLMEGSGRRCTQALVYIYNVSTSLTYNRKYTMAPVAPLCSVSLAGFGIWGLSTPGLPLDAT